MKSRSVPTRGISLPRLRRRGPCLKLLTGPPGFLFLSQRIPSTFHQRHLAAAVPFAVIGAGRFAAAAESFAVVESSARMFLRGRARPLAAARIIPMLAVPFALIQSAAEMNIDRSN